MKRPAHIFACIALITMPLATEHVAAQILEEVVVTAQKRAQNLQDVPVSVAAMSGDTINERGLENLARVTESIPNVFVAETAIDSSIQMRGIKTGDNRGMEQSVVMYVDGLYFGRSQLIRMPIFDLERVEALRGPQPTLFGKNAIAGALSLTSAPPTDSFEGWVRASYEFEHEEPKLQAVLSGPLSENVSGRLSASYREMDGFMKNQISGDNEPDISEYFVRGSLQWDVTPDLLARLKVEYADWSRDGWALEVHKAVDSYNEIFSGPLFVETEQNFRNETSKSTSDNDVFDAVLALQYQMGDLTLESITGWVEYDTEEVYDVDTTRLDLLDGTRFEENYEQFSQEIRVSSPAEDRLSYIAGFYFQDSDLELPVDEIYFGELLTITPLAPLAESFTAREFAQDTTLWSVFAQFDYQLSDTLGLTVGGRYSEEDKDAQRSVEIVAQPGNTGSAVPFPPPYGDLLNFLYSQLNVFPHSVSESRNESSFDPLVRLQYEPNDSILTYVSYTQGSKAGGFDVRGNSLPGSPVPVPGTFEFEDEKATNYELGLKYGSDQLVLNAAVFYTEYEDLQTSIFDGTYSFNVQNAAEATIRGFEVDSRYAVSEDFQLYGALGYVDFEYDSFEDGQCAYPEEGVCSYTGDRPGLSPEWTSNLGVDFSRELESGFELSTNLNVNYSDSYLTEDNGDPNSKQDSFALLSAWVALESASGSWRVSLIGDNLTDEAVLLDGGSIPLATTLTQNTGNGYWGYFNRPRNYTLAFEYRFD